MYTQAAARGPELWIEIGRLLEPGLSFRLESKSFQHVCQAPLKYLAQWVVFERALGLSLRLLVAPEQQEEEIRIPTAHVPVHWLVADGVTKPALGFLEIRFV